MTLRVLAAAIYHIQASLRKLQRQNKCAPSSRICQVVRPHAYEYARNYPQLCCKSVHYATIVAGASN